MSKTEEEVATLTEDMNVKLTKGQLEVLSQWIDEKCKASFTRGKYLNQQEMEFIHDRIDKLSINVNRYAKDPSYC